MPMLFRDHKGALADSMATVYYVRDRQHFIEIMRDRLSPWQREVPDEDITIEPYGFDDRIAWDSHIVTLSGYGVLGFTNGPLAPSLSETPALRFRERLDGTGAQMESVKGVENFADLLAILNNAFAPYDRVVTRDAVSIRPDDGAARPKTWPDQYRVEVRGYGVAGWLSGPLGE
jgi:hypothetical protein